MPNNVVSTLKIGNQVYDIKDSYIRNLVTSVLEITAENNEIISNRLNNLNDRAFDNLIKVENDNWSNVNSIQSGIYRIEHSSNNAVTEYSILINKQDANTQLNIRNNDIYYRNKVNGVWGDWTVLTPNLSLSSNYTQSSLENAQLHLSPNDSFELAFSKLEKAIMDNERIAAASLNDLNSRIETINDIGAEANVQSDWEESDSTSDAYIANKPNIPKIYFGVSTSSASVAGKTATVETFPLDANNKPLEGTIVAVKYAVTNTVKTSGSTYTLNVNNTGAYPMYYNNAELTTSSIANTLVAGYLNRYVFYVFNGTQWVFVTAGFDTDTTYSNAKLGQVYGTCSTAEATEAKTSSISSYTLAIGGIVAIKFTYAVPAGSTLNITSKGAKPIYYRGAAITNGVIKAGDVAYFIYSTYYHLLGIDRWGLDIDNKVDKVAGKGLSTEDYTTAEKTKLSGIAAGAEVNVQSDWEESDSTSDAYIANKPFESVNEEQFIVDSTTKELSINKDILPVDYSKQYLTFVATEAGTFTFRPGKNNIISYSTDNGSTWTEGSSIEVNSGDKVLWKGTMTPSGSGIGHFSSTANFGVQGNVMSLLFGDDFKGKVDLTGKSYAFYWLFYNNTKVVSAENLSLPATTLAGNCYNGMFRGCTSLVTAPELPVTTLDGYCYSEMFLGCTSLTTAPELPATTLANYCYDYMFASCTALTAAPVLPATTLANSCYNGMFRGCTSLVTAPVLPATTLANSCYSNMFNDCTKLNYIKAMFTTTPSDDFTSNWVSGVSSTGTFIKNSEATWDVTGNDGIPTGWNVYTESQWKEVKHYELDALEDSLDDVHETIASALNDLDSRIEAIDEVGAQANVIEAIKVNDELLPITNKTVNIYNSYTIELREIWSDNKALVEFKDSTITPETLITILNKYNYNNVVFKLFDEIDGFPPSNYYFNLDLSQLICNITYDEQNNTITSISSFVIIDLKDSSLVSILNTNNQFYIVSWNENDNKWEFALHRVQTGITSYAYTDLNPHETTTTISAFDTDGKNNNAKIELIGKENANKNAEINITTETNDGLKWNRRVVAVEEYCEKTKEYYSKQYLTFVAKENGTFTFTPQNNNVISYSINGSNWIEDNEVAVSNGDKVLWKGSMAVSLNGIGKFSSTANFDVQGNIMSLLYGDEFIGKTDLTGKNYAFYQLFYNNTKVVSAENLILPATMLADSCYRDMFDGCTSLTTAPSILPATTLTDSCYRTMFTFCTSLTKAPELPATMLASYCYGAMFYNCTSLNYIKAMFLTIPNVSCTRNWVCGVSSTGTFIKNSSASWDVRGYDGVPEYWNNYLSTEINTINNKIQKIDPLILANNEYYIQKSNSVILPLSHPDLSTQPSILPERFGKYYIYEVMVPIFGDNIINDLSNTSDEEIYVYEKNNESYLAFKEGGLLMNDSTIINASLIGNGVYDNPTIIKDEIIEEIDYANEYLTFVAKESGTFTFTPNNDNVISYSIDNGLTWTEGNNVTINNGDKVLWKGSMTPNNSGIGAFSSTANFDAQGNIMSLLYGDEFIGQTDLTGNNNIFNRLFYQNTKIVSAKNLILPATILAPNCYEEMFNGCGSLTTAPELPATTLAESCYDSMFANCTALTTAPELPATTLTIGCYASMFYHCGMLNYIKAMFTTTPTVSYTSIWVDGVSNTGTFVKNSAATWNVTGNNGIPSGWTVDTVSYEDTPYEYSTIGINSKFKINKIYTNLPLSTYASKMNYLLVKYYNDQYLGYYENYYE